MSKGKHVIGPSVRLDIEDPRAAADVTWLRQTAAYARKTWPTAVVLEIYHANQLIVGINLADEALVKPETKQ